jgi:alkylated DNA repair dioxygenase AlkB
MLNILPGEGVVNYYGIIWPLQLADKMYTQLLNEIEWKHDEAIIAGKHIITKRKVALYAAIKLQYTYSNVSKSALQFTPLLIEIKEQIELLTGYQYNACLLNLYHNGAEGMAYHSDNEKQLNKNCGIASVSLGANRKFLFKNKISKQTVGLVLQHGSLLLMHPPTQQFWNHRLPLSTVVNEPRISLTFRQMNT